jgi:hypothetical protein
MCRDDVSAEFVERIKGAAVHLGEVMTFDEFKVWLRSIDTGSVSG